MSQNKDVVVMFNGACQHSFSAKKDCLVTLNAGTNVVSIEKLERLTGKTGDEELDAMKSQSFINMHDTGEIEIINDEAVVEVVSAQKDNVTGINANTAGNKETIIIDTVKLGAKDAITVIGAEIDADIIQGYLDAENAADTPRVTVIKACEDAITALLAEPANTGDEK